MKRKPVASRTVLSLGYMADDAILEVEFRDSRVYQYYLVPPAVFAGLDRATSIGRYLNENVIGKFPFRHIR